MTVWLSHSLLRIAVLVALLAAAGCASSVEPADDSGVVHDVADGGADARNGSDAVTDVAVVDAGDAGARDAGANGASIEADGGLPVAPPYHDVREPLNWSFADLGTVASAAGGVAGTAFDGRFMYFAPGGEGPVVRYDASGVFDATASWSSFYPSTVNANAGEFRGAAFDGRYLYLVPYGCPTSCAGTTGLGGVVTRYDTHTPFESPGSWSTFDLTSIDAGATGYVGAAFDGRYLYMVPYGRDRAYQSLVARYDTQATFEAGSSWTTFDTTTLGPGSEGFYGATFDGRYLYLSPYAAGAGSYNSIITRYDTHATFDAVSSWATFDTSAVDARAIGYFGATFDGRYAYFVPYTSDGSYAGLLARCDTTSDFGNPASWSFFDTRSLGVFPQGALFDGRYVYLVPSGGPSGASGLTARLDTRASFTARSSWTTFDTSTVNPGAVWFWGGGFDGEYIYFAPSLGSTIARFDARNPPALPAAYHGSFF